MLTSRIQYLLSKPPKTDAKQSRQNSDSVIRSRLSQRRSHCIVGSIGKLREVDSGTLNDPATGSFSLVCSFPKVNAAPESYREKSRVCASLGRNDKTMLGCKTRTTMTGADPFDCGRTNGTRIECCGHRRSSSSTVSCDRPRQAGIGFERMRADGYWRRASGNKGAPGPVIVSTQEERWNV